MIDKGIFDSSISYHVEAICFCYMVILQNELNETINLWNSHVQSQLETLIAVEVNQMFCIFCQEPTRPVIALFLLQWTTSF